MKKVFLSVGHGGSDPGACANGYREKDINLTVALACEAALKRHGVSVLMNRYTDVATTASNDTSACNKFAPDVAVDIHCNAGGGNGAEVYHHFGGGVGKTLALNILDEMGKIGQNSRGAKTRKNSNGRDYYYFIRDTSAPAVIVECAFLDNAEDVKILSTKEKQEAMGVAIAKGVLRTLGVAWKAETANDTPKEKTAPAVTSFPTLSLGSEGECVRALQILLIGRGYHCGGYGADGDFGKATKKAVTDYQTAKKLDIDGIAGEQTWRSLLGMEGV